LVGGGDFADYDDLGRASIVLAVAAMDSYFTDAFIEKLVPFLQRSRPTKGLVQILEKADFGVADALQLLNQFNPLSRVKKILANHLDRFVTQSTARIDDLFLAYGYKDLSVRAQAKTKRKSVLKTVAHLVARRHQIVHDGDYQRNGKLRKFSQSATTKEIRTLESFVKACDEILFPDSN
jgi:HEPN superfamily RiboL-PSP-like protein